MKYNTKEHKIWSKSVREAWNNKCAVCGIVHLSMAPNAKGVPKKVILDAHHLVSAKEHRYNPIVGILLCKKHHKFSKSFSAHGNGLLFFRFLEEKYHSVYQYAMNLLIKLEK